METNYTVRALSPRAPVTLRRREVTSLDEVLALHRECPKADLGITGPDGELIWAYWPEFDDELSVLRRSGTRSW